MTRKGWLLFTAMAVIWGIPYLFIKIAVRELDPTVVVFVRVGIAALVLLPVALQRGALRKVRGRWLLIAALACIQIIGPFLLITYGEQHITSSLTSLLIAADPLLVVLFALRFDPGERVNRPRLLGLLIGMSGVITLLGLDIGGDAQRLLGAGLVLLATMAYAISALLIKRPSIATLPGLGVVTGECLTTTIVLLPLAATRLPARFPGLDVVASLLILGLICTALAYVLFFALVSEVGAGRATVITYVNPAVSVLLGVFLLGEPLNPPTAAGFLLIILGSWLSTGGAFSARAKRLSPAMQQQDSGQIVAVNRQDAPVEP
jgi:drug/metabolite transporter (DMT)-like permease